MRTLVAAIGMLVLASCGALGRSGVTETLTRAPVLGAARVSIPLYREHYVTYETGGDLMSTLAGVGSTSTSGERRSVSDVDTLGAVVIDLRSGRCERAAAAAPETASAWDRPVALAPGVFYDAPGARLYRGDREIVASVGTTTHVVVDDPHRRVMWLEGTDALIWVGELIDVVYGQRWRYQTATARLGDRLFAPTETGVIELAAAPLAELAVHAPETPAPRLQLVGFDGTAFVFHRPERDAIAVFDVATRGWREHRYGACMP